MKVEFTRLSGRDPCFDIAGIASSILATSPHGASG
jgi:hypothetical protein